MRARRQQCRGIIVTNAPGSILIAQGSEMKGAGWAIIRREGLLCPRDPKFLWSDWHWSQWRGGWVPSHCAPNEYGAGWAGPYGGQAGPFYGGWGNGGYGGGQGPYGGLGNYGNGWVNPPR